MRWLIDRLAEAMRATAATGMQTRVFNGVNFRALGLAAQQAIPETIVAAAIRVPNLEYGGDLTITAPPPARHFTLLHGFRKTGSRWVVRQDQQGFITSTGRFVSREEAHAIAVASGQPMIDHPSRVDGILYSEDLW